MARSGTDTTKVLPGVGPSSTEHPTSSGDQAHHMEARWKSSSGLDPGVEATAEDKETSAASTAAHTPISTDLRRAGSESRNRLTARALAWESSVAWSSSLVSRAASPRASDWRSWFGSLHLPGLADCAGVALRRPYPRGRRPAAGGLLVACREPRRCSTRPEGVLVPTREGA